MIRGQPWVLAFAFYQGLRQFLFATAYTDLTGKELPGILLSPPLPHQSNDGIVDSSHGIWLYLVPGTPTQVLVLVKQMLCSLGLLSTNHVVVHTLDSQH